MSFLTDRTGLARATAASLFAALSLLTAVPAQAGGSLQTVDLSSAVPTEDPDFDLVHTVDLRWDVRCIPVAYRINDTLDPIPNPLGPPVLDLAEARSALAGSFAVWNRIPTSFIESGIVGTTGNAGTRGFDFVNELTFRTPAGFSALASSPSTSLAADAFLADGLDIDGDGDPDVSAAITTCADVDGDGDVEFPEGSYAAGTILDNDVQFNTAVRYTVDPADADTSTLSVDLVGLAVHELGHSHGRSHVPNNQKSDDSGFGATMFPFIDTGDPAAELEIRELDSDDVAWTSYDYPEGSAAGGPAALQAGDVAFSDAYGLITGSVTDGDTGLPLVGAAVGAFSTAGDALVTTGFSGTARLRVRGDGALFFPLDPASGIVHGDFTLPVERGMYTVGLEAVDGTPIAPGQVNFDLQVGGFFGQLDFQEERFDGDAEAALEYAPGRSVPVNATTPEGAGEAVDLVTNVTAALAPFGSFDFFGFTGGPGGLIYAVRFPRSEVRSVVDDGLEVLQMATFRTQLFDASVVPRFSRAALATGVVNADGGVSVHLAEPLRHQAPFIAQDRDFSPFYFERAAQLAARLRQWLDHGPPEEDLFLVLQIPQPPWPGANGRAPGIGLDGRPGGVNDGPILGRSYVSFDDGATWVAETRFNYMFSLVFTARPPE